MSIVDKFIQMVPFILQEYVCCSLSKYRLFIFCCLTCLLVKIIQLISDIEGLKFKDLLTGQSIYKICIRNNWRKRTKLFLGIFSPFLLHTVQCIHGLCFFLSLRYPSLQEGEDALGSHVWRDSYIFLLWSCLLFSTYLPFNLLYVQIKRHNKLLKIRGMTLHQVLHEPYGHEEHLTRIRMRWYLPQLKLFRVYHILLEVPASRFAQEPKMIYLKLQYDLLSCSIACCGCKVHAKKLPHCFFLNNDKPWQILLAYLEL